MWGKVRSVTADGSRRAPSSFGKKTADTVSVRDAIEKRQYNWRVAKAEARLGQ
jgi:hypothetical protein